jgi:MFS family permease
VEPQGGLRRGFASLRHRDFAVFWSAALVSNTGSWMQSIAVPYVIYVMTKSTTWLGVSAFMGFFPALVMGPLAGTLADRFSRKNIVLVTQAGAMIVAFSLWGFWELGWATPWRIVIHLLISGIFSGINITSWQSFVPLLVPREDMLNAVRLNSMQFTAARAFGPAIAGLVLARYGASWAFLGNALSYVLVLAALFTVHPRSAGSIGGGGRVRDQFREGLGYVRARQALVVPVLTITFVSFFGSSLVQLAPALASDQFGVGKAGYGLLVAAFGAGAVVGSLVISIGGDSAPRSRVALTGLFVMSGGIFALAASPIYGIGLVALFLMGVSYVLVAVSLNTSIQIRVADEYRGRVLSIYLMGLLAGVPVGALIEGRLADLVGLRQTVALAGAALVAYAVFAVVRFGGMAALDEALETEVLPPVVLEGSPA